jgi:hypothetical protein
MKSTCLLVGCVVMLAGCGHAINYTYSKRNFTSECNPVCPWTVSPHRDGQPFSVRRSGGRPSLHLPCCCDNSVSVTDMKKNPESPWQVSACRDGQPPFVLGCFSARGLTRFLRFCGGIYARRKHRLGETNARQRAKV